MKLFKKALVASAVVGAFSAQAVTVSSDKVKISEEGLAVAKKVIIAEAGGNALTLDFVVGSLTPASSFIELEFSEGVDLSNVNITSSSINNVVGSGVGNVEIDGNSNGNTAQAHAIFDYGTGSFTFDAISLGESEDKKKDVLGFKVNLGNPLVANSAFRLTIGEIDGANGIVLKGTEEVCYTSFENNSGEKGAVIETGCSPISEVESQYAFSVTQEWDGKIERVDQVTFSRDGDVGHTDQDTLKFTIVNNETLEAAITAADAEIEIEGNFKDLLTTDFEANAGSAIEPVTVASGEDSINFTVADADLAATATGSKGYVEFNLDTASVVIPQTGAMTATVEFVNGTDVYKKISDAAGAWELDATVINVPYFPVLYSGVVSTVHIANEGSEADVIVRAIDEYGMEHGPLDLGRDLGENKVERITAGELATLFGIDKKTKLSVTFNIDGYASDVSANATVQSSTGRSEVSNSQQKVDGKQ